MRKGLLGIFARAAFVALTLSACGGGGGNTVASGGTGGTGIVSTGVMLRGSVIVNGVHFDDTIANILVDDTPKTPIDLRDGMVVQVKGRVNDDGITGTAERVEAQVEVRGAVTSVDAAANPQSLVVLGQTVVVDDLTVYSGVANFGALSVSQLIEVHGLRDSIGNLHATRVEANTAQMADETFDEIRGVVGGGAGTNPTTFNLGGQVVNAAGAVIAPLGASYQNGDVVEVHCNSRPCVNAGVFQASRLDVERAEDAAFQPGGGERFDVEGLVSGFAAHPGSFFVAGKPVTTSAFTTFRGGLASDLANGIKVEAEGSWDGASLVATRIEFKRSVIRLQGATANRNVTTNTFDLQIANGTYAVKIELDAATSGALPADGLTCVQVRGERKSPASPLVVKAGEVNLGCSNSNRHFIQAPVEAETPETFVTLLGFQLDVSNPTDVPPYVDVNGQPMTRPAFFSAVTPAGINPANVAVPGTLVKVIFENGSSTVRQAELED